MELSNFLWIFIAIAAFVSGGLSALILVNYFLADGEKNLVVTSVTTTSPEGVVTVHDPEELELKL